MYVTEVKQSSGIMMSGPFVKTGLLNPSARPLPPSGPILMCVVEGMVAPDVPVSAFKFPIRNY